MNIDWQYTEQNVNWNELSHLYKLAPLGDKKPKDLEIAFGNSMYKCFLFSKGELVGVGRAMADGVDCSYICDVAILPQYQQSGLGKSIVSKLVELSKGHRKIILYSYPGKEAFYKKLGFNRMSTAMAIFENQSQAIEWGLVNEA
ncbi:GNAT family N-acetyltransferase [Psychromonas algicola]|uniref:GNAT family N-acetyltransferase n=1 Tax=Psychromonas algicola TaxID=2555642 RepID=UPI00106797F1|nr:GNAT family N-acetyltransferase [Psychromonas sp. RZ5]TEW44070.1 GNAT family N-acetyltransferase [Psychromonas sp. RZ5]